MLTCFLLQNTLRDTMVSADASFSPMLVVGQFLDALFQDHVLPRRCSVKDSMSLPRHLRSITSHFAQPLYSCPTYSQMDFLCLILNLFSGVPEAYQVLRCQPSTTEEELSLFLKRVGHHHSHYLMLGVNRLPFKLQEVRSVGECGGVSAMCVSGPFMPSALVLE